MTVTLRGRELDEAIANAVSKMNDLMRKDGWAHYHNYEEEDDMTADNDKLARLWEAVDNEKDAKRQAMAEHNKTIKELESEARLLAKQIRGEG